MSDSDDEVFFEQTAGSLIRPYTLTRGRTAQARHDLDMITMVRIAESTQSQAPRLDAEYTEILRLCVVPQSIAELAAQLRQPLFATKILVGDLIDSGHLTFRAARQSADTGNLDLMRAVLQHLKAL
jgi:hypothetical protein